MSDAIVESKEKKPIEILIHSKREKCRRISSSFTFFCSVGHIVVVIFDFWLSICL